MITTGEAYILRTCSADMTSHGDFIWPREGRVEAPDWKPTEECGNGLHGFLWGEGDGYLADWSADAVWIVAKISEWLDLDGKVKFPNAEVVFCGDRLAATARIAELGARGAIVGGTATAGYGGTATAGDGGTATAGYRGTATAGYRGTATAGDDGTATAGNYGTATAGDGGTATAGYGGTLIIRWFDGCRYRTAVGYVGEDGILPGVGYRVDAGKFVAVEKEAS
jgi:hypothetical protein